MADLCADLADGYDLSAFNDKIGLMSGMFTNVLVSPFKMDDFLFGGFSFMTDLPTLELDEQIELSSEIAEDNKVALLKVVRELI